MVYLCLVFYTKISPARLGRHSVVPSTSTFWPWTDLTLPTFLWNRTAFYILHLGSNMRCSKRRIVTKSEIHLIEMWPIAIYLQSLNPWIHVLRTITQYEDTELHQKLHVHLPCLHNYNIVSESYLLVPKTCIHHPLYRLDKKLFSIEIYLGRLTSWVGNRSMKNSILSGLNNLWTTLSFTSSPLKHLNCIHAAQ